MAPKKPMKVITLALNGSGDRILKSGQVEPNGDIQIRRGERIRFEYDDGTETFALFIIGFTPDQPGEQDDSPFSAKVYVTDDGSLEKNVRSNAKKGRYDYVLAVLKANGQFVTEDPQIIVQ